MREPGDAGCVAALVAWLRSRSDCTLEDGLRPEELAAAQQQFGLRFPAIWSQVLAQVHPMSLPEPPRDADGLLRWTRFPDWRGRDPESTMDMVRWPAEGVMFDVEHADFWWTEWGSRPGSLEARLAVAQTFLAALPPMTPLMAGLYVDASPESPVFSIHQVDLYVTAVTLCDLPDGRSQDEVLESDYPIGRVPFWSLLHAWFQFELEPGSRFHALGGWG